MLVILLTMEDSEINSKVDQLLAQFWDAHEKLLIDMDNIDEGEYFKRQHEMWRFRNEAAAISDEYFLFSCWGMSEKANKLYGEGCSARYLEFLINNQ